MQFTKLTPGFFKKSEFTRSVLTLTAGTAVAQAITLIMMPVLTRLYTPHDFGIWALFNSIITIVGIIATGRYEMAIILPKNDNDSINILAISSIISFGISLFSLLLLIIFRDYILFFFENPEIGNYLYLAPVTIFFQGIFQAFNYWSVRKKTYKRNALSRASQSFTGASGQYVFGVSQAGPIGLIAGTIIGQLTATIIIVWEPIKNLKKYINRISKAEIKSNLRTYKDFPLVNGPHALVSAFQDNGIYFFIKSLIGAYILGSFSIAVRILNAPSGLLAQSINQVFYERATKHYNDGLPVKPLMYSIHKRLFLLGLPFFIILLLFSPYIFEIVFSEAYRQAGVIASILSPWIFLNFVVASTQGIFLILNKQKQVFLLSLIDLFLRIFAIFIGYWTNNYKHAFICMSLFCSIFIISTLIWAYKISDFKPKLSTSDSAIRK